MAAIAGAGVGRAGQFVQRVLELARRPFEINQAGIAADRITFQQERQLAGRDEHTLAARYCDDVTSP
jgi:hypothetical protein